MSVRKVKDGSDMAGEPKNIPCCQAMSPMSSLKRAGLALARSGNGRPGNAGRPASRCLPPPL